MSMKFNKKAKYSSFLLLVLCSMLMIACEKKEETPDVVFETGTVIDVEGRVYNTVKIGNQWWMAEDLKVKKYRNGDYILDIGIDLPSDDIRWSKNTSGAYCIEDTYNTYLYNWYAISNDSTGIAPEGWHIPTDNEWKELEIHLGMNQADADKLNWRGAHEGEKLKLKSKTTGCWKEYDSVWDTNESGFTALAKGCRLFNGVFGVPGEGQTGFWWSASESSNRDAYYRHLDYKNANVFRYYGSKNYGFAIRCVKDK